MSEIKSALELALEKTEDVQGDPKSVEMHEHKQTGKRLVTKVIDGESIDLAAELGRYEGDKRRWVEQGFFEVLVMNVKLPSDELELERIRRLQKGFQAVIRDKEQLRELFRQLDSLLGQYVENRREMIEGVRRQFEGRIRQKEQELQRQTGTAVRLDPASDPEFTQYLRENMNRLQQQYTGVLDQVKEQLNLLFDAGR